METSYKKINSKTKKVTFKFETNINWKPADDWCWVNCPFATLIPLGETCRFITDDKIIKCPFIRNNKEI